MTEDTDNNTATRRHDCTRCRVVATRDDALVVRTADDNDGRTLRVAYGHEPGTDDYAYLREIAGLGTQLNLIDTRTLGGTTYAAQIALEPDFLVDISPLAACFEEFGHHPLLYTLNRLKERPNTRHTILGNFAGMALDDIINRKEFNMGETIRKNFREKAMEYATCTDFNARTFKADAEQQVRNLQQTVHELLKRYDRTKVVLEPSFVCERLGLQGRVDMMTVDRSMLVEQKSGRNLHIELGNPDRANSNYIEKHYVQLLLYYGMLRYNFDNDDTEPTTMLLYSRYAWPQSIICTNHAEADLREAMAFRNRVVALEHSMARNGFETVVDDITPETLNVKNTHSDFFTRFQLPSLRSITDRLSRMEAPERAYLCRMATFVLREQLLAKTGVAVTTSGSAADMWRMTTAEKLDAGNIYIGMTIERRANQLSTDDADDDAERIVLNVPDCGDDFAPNFRRGDMVCVYAYAEGDEPDARRATLFKGVMAEIGASRIVVHLNNALHNPDVLEERDSRGRRMLYAVEHATSDVSTTAMLRSLFDFVGSSEERRQLLLGMRKPRRNSTARLTRSYGDYFDDIMTRVVQADDYFLLQGPPGTGKTSTAMRHIVEEQLRRDSSVSILLTAYTNRAVDEICSMLCDASIDFVRIGNEYSCDERFKPHLLSTIAGQTPRLDTLKARLKAVRVYAATTTTLMSKPYIFALKQFELAIVDEAGQIAEPALIGLLAAHRPGRPAEPAIGRFVLIGDHKQLPAVVQQSADDSAVVEPCLRDAGLTNCRDSLFERLMRIERREGRSEFVGLLRRQGRMHPDIADYAGTMFYADEQLVPVPCPHQKERLPRYAGEAADELDTLLKTKRVVFVPCSGAKAAGVSDKVNVGEARIVADIVERIRRLSGEEFDAETSVGVIVPYRNQITMIRREMERRQIDCADQLCVDTVERYQGSQREVIVCSMTVSNDTQLDFLTSNCFDDNGRTIDRKLNVTLTRARRQLIITGDPEVLCHNDVYATLIDKIKQNGGGYAPWHLRHTQQ